MGPKAEAKSTSQSAASQVTRTGTFGPYLLEERLAVGGSAEIFLARPTQGSAPAARFVIKRLLPGLLEAGEGESLVQEAELHRAVTADRARRPAELPLTWRIPDAEPEQVEFLGIESRLVPAPVSGGKKIEWNGKPVTLTVPHLKTTEPVLEVKVPKAYWIPSTWPEVIARLEAHGVLLERLGEARELELEMVRLTEPVLAKAPYEGRVPVTCTPVAELRTQLFPAGSVRVTTDQPLGELAVLLLEPESPDSFFQWGFFHEVLQRTEYFEGYVMEPLAERMMAENPELKREFEALLESDPEFAKNGRARLHWFYERSEYFDERWQLYPVAREW